MAFDMHHLSFCLVLIFVVGFGFGEKLNERRILLPYNTGVPTNFTLEALNGNSCYKWSSSRPDVASIKHLDSPSCSMKAIVTVVSSSSKRQSTVITAHDLNTNLKIRCDVEVGVIDHILITTTTREIVYGELPETIKAIALNDKNDTFTSIGGVQLDWTISPLDIIRYRAWSSSSYASPDFVEFWESRGAKSSHVLVEGIRTGTAKIKARIMGDAYQDVLPAEITVHVVANLMLIPSNDLFVVRGSKVIFRAEISKQGPRVPLNLPLPQYYLEVLDDTVAKFDEQNNQLEAINEGHTSLVLRDRNIDSDHDGFLSQTSTDIHVMRPSYLSIEITPGESFQLRTDTVYTVLISLHDDWHHRLFLSDNLNLKVEFPENYFTILKSTNNGTVYEVRTLKAGVCKLKAQFLGAGSYALETPLEHLQDVTIYPPIALEPKIIHLPWLPTVKPEYTVHIVASGASGQYNWDTENDTMAQVKYSLGKSSHATVYTKGAGDVSITCTDVHNSLLFNSLMKIQIQPIDAIEVLPSIVETHIGGNVILPIAVLGYQDGQNDQKFYFDDCEQVQFDVEIVEKNRVRYEKNNFFPGMGKHSCRSLSFECLSSGNSRVWIHYASEPERKISISAIVGCYQPLKLIHPSEFAVLSLGANIDIAFEGGPKSWSLYPEGHYTKATATNDTIVSIKEIKDRYRYNKDLHVFRTRCLAYGETKINLEVGNTPSPTLTNPASTFSTVKVICAKPETLIIRPRMKSTCPQQEMTFTLEKNKNIELDVQVLDGNGNQFYNFSTLYFEWTKDGTGAFEFLNGVSEEVNGAKGYFSLTRSKQVLKGLVSVRSRIRAHITGYQRSYFGDRFSVQREIDLILTNPTSLAENNLSILKHSDYKRTILVENGSGYFSFEWTSKPAIDIELVKSNIRNFNIVPNQIGNGLITINDLCLDFPPLSIVYSVVEAVDFSVNIIDKIQLGTSVEGVFHVIDNRGQRIDSSLHSYLDISIVSSNNFVQISEIKPKNEYQSSFMIKAERLGLSKIVLQTQSDKVRSIQSQPMEIQIFSPLQIIPSNITIIVGNHFQSTFIGGPQTQRNMDFSIGDTSIATVTSNGVIQGVRHGHTKLTVRVMNVNNFEYSRAVVDLYIVPLRKIKIWTPVNQVLVGSHIPLYVIGSSEKHETPFTFGQSDPPLSIKWTLSNEKIGSMECSFQKNGLIESIPDQIAAKFVAKSIGTVSLKVTVKVTVPSFDTDKEQIVSNQLLSDTVQIQVYSDYMLSTSAPYFDYAPNSVEHFSTKVLLLSSQAELALHFNHLDSVQYKVFNATQVKIVNQTDNLILQAGDVLESASLTIQRDIHKTGLLQYLSYAVHIEKVRYLSLEFETKKAGQMKPEQVEMFLNTLDVFPIGSEFVFSVNFYDNIGRRFDAVKSNLKWILSRNDIITVLGGSADPNSIRIRSLKQGSVILFIKDLVNQIGQYYKINVGSVIEPHSDPIALHTGDIICARSMFSSAEDSNGVWSLENSKNQIGYVVPTRGTLIALNKGHSMLVYNHSYVSGLSTYAKILVQPIEAFALDADSILGITTTSVLSIPIKTHVNARTTGSGCTSQSDIDSLVRILKLNHLLPFTCDIWFDDSTLAPLWTVQLGYSLSTSSWACMLTPNNDLDMETISQYNLNVTITVMQNIQFSNDIDPISTLHQIQIPFLPTFEMTTKQIILTSDSKQVTFTVTSVKQVLNELMIKSSNDDILYVRKYFDEQQDNLLRVMVVLNNADIFSNDVSNLHLTLTNSLTNQSEKIPVQIKLYGPLSQLPEQIFSQSLYMTSGLFIMTLLFAFVIYFIIRRLSNISFKMDNPNNDSTNDGFLNFWKSNQSSNINSSPSSPKRVIDYRSSPSTPVTDFSNRSRLLSQTPSSPTQDPLTPSSPKVGRPLYSTRQYLIK